MECPDCGYVWMSPFDKECPRCKWFRQPRDDTHLTGATPQPQRPAQRSPTGSPSWLGISKETKWGCLAPLALLLVLIGSCYARTLRLPLPDILTDSVGQVVRADNFEVVIDAVRIHPILDVDPRVVAEVWLTVYNRRGGEIRFGAADVEFGGSGPATIWSLYEDKLGLHSNQRWNDDTPVKPGEKRKGYVLFDADAHSPFPSAGVVVSPNFTNSSLTIHTPAAVVEAAAQQAVALEQRQEADKGRRQEAIQRVVADILANAMRAPDNFFLLGYRMGPMTGQVDGEPWCTLQVSDHWYLLTDAEKKRVANDIFKPLQEARQAAKLDLEDINPTLVIQDQRGLTVAEPGWFGWGMRVVR